MDLNSNSADSEKATNVRTIKEIALKKYQQIQCSVHDRCRPTNIKIISIMTFIKIKCGGK